MLFEGVRALEFNMLRKDYLLDRWVVIATSRKRRPTDFVKKPVETKAKVCPLCPGRERMTPPAVLLYKISDGKLVKEKDSDGFRHKDWLVRCVPNLYPAFTPPTRDDVRRKRGLSEAWGHHEVLIESPNHDEHPGNARVSQLIHVVNAYIDRLKTLSAKPYVEYVSIFRNHGVDAGASLSHAHSQIIAMPFVPTTVKAELKASRISYRKNGGCVFCDIIKRERRSERFIWENQSFVVFAPWASVHPLAFWIFPKKHVSTPAQMRKKEVEAFARTLRICLGALKTLVNNPAYNYGFHIAPAKDAEAKKYYHWHLEVYPKLAIWAGFEKSTGVYINTVPPEDSAEELRKAAVEEEKKLG
ncbi:MAG TPA: DUF4921 family protein [Candidatus Bathyarchaeota archaeon]|nr:DUF4921 family protein [Candidatus Bathyarchaeota archaeon]